MPDADCTAKAGAGHLRSLELSAKNDWGLFVLPAVERFILVIFIAVKRWIASQLYFVWPCRRMRALLWIVSPPWQAFLYAVCQGFFMFLALVVSDFVVSLEIACAPMLASLQEFFSKIFKITAGIGGGWGKYYRK